MKDALDTHSESFDHMTGEERGRGRGREARGRMKRIKEQKAGKNGWKDVKVREMNRFSSMCVSVCSSLRHL